MKWNWSAAVVVCASVAGVVKGQQYTVTDLGRLAASGTYIPTAINSRGDVVGYLQVNGLEDGGFLYTNGKMVDLGALGVSAAYGINDAGDIVGFGSGGAFLYHNGVMTYFAGQYSQAYGINNLGPVVGSYSATPSETHAFLYANGTFTDLSSLVPGWWSQATAITDSGMMFGRNSISATQNMLPYVVAGGVLTELEQFDGLYSAGPGAMNNLGQVAWTSHQSGSEKAYLYSGGTITGLGPALSVAYGINDSGTVVGAVESANGGAAILFPGGWTDLNTLIPAGTGWRLGYATAINDAGQIAGWGEEWEWGY